MAEMDIGDVLRYLPHRYPFLMLDRVLEFEAGERLLALKNVTYNEQFFPGHFPKAPVMPAVLVLEAMAQAAGLLAILSAEQLPDETSVYYFVGIDKARFRKPVTPGDQLIIEVLHRRTARGVSKVGAQATVVDSVVASAELMGALRDLHN